MGVAAFIPAKMTSQRLPQKNMRVLCGRPLLYYSIRVAQLSRAVSTTVVSSESPIVLDYAITQGASVHRRTPDLSEPAVRNVDVLRHWYEPLEEKPEIVVLLQPTHPMRDPEDLSRAVDQLRNDPEADSLFTVLRTAALTGVVRDGVFWPDVNLPRNVETESPRFRNTGSFYLFRPERSFLTAKPFGERIRAYELRRPEWEVDIDHEHDFDCAEAIFRKQVELLGKYA